MKSRMLLLVLMAVSAISLHAQGQGGDLPVRVVNGVSYRVHTVAKGETLYKISRLYGCTVEELKTANSGKESLKVGEELLIPSKNAVVPPKESASTTIHVVAKGETLYKIAARYGTTAARIRELNGLRGDALKIGQKLKVPAAAGKKPDNEEKPADIQDTAKKRPVRPVTPPVKTEEKPREDVNPGIPDKPKYVPAETISEKEETGLAKVVSGKMEDTRSHVLHPSLPKGSIVVVINPANGRMAYCKVVDNYIPSEYSGTGIILTPAVSEKIGLQGGIGDVKIRYAAP